METTYTLTELSREAAVSPRTVRYYIQHDLLPPPKGAGPGSHYDSGHLDRLRLIKRLKDSHLPLAEIRKQIKPLTDEEVQTVLDKESEEVADSAVDYIRSVLDVRETALRSSDSDLLFDVYDEFTGPFAPRLRPSRPEPTRAHWERIGLSPDIELHVRRPLSHQENKAVNRILEAAREILQEEAP
jgi:DNA-binding transcriptional MerR regulator